MATITVVIAEKHRPAQTLLAAEALKAAARAEGHSLTLSTPDNAAADAARADLALWVGPVSEPFTASRFTEATLDSVLEDPKGILSSLLAPPRQGGALRLAAVTSCPTGIAHTFMAAEGLIQAAQALGHTIHVETQGSVGAQDTLSAEQIRDADIVIIAADTQVGTDRFAGKRIFKTSTKSAIHNGQALIREAIDKAAVATPGATSAASPSDTDTARPGPYKHLMTGVSFMLPFVVAGGILIAIAFALGGIYAYDDAHKGTLAWALFQIGAKSAFALMVPILAGYIAFSVADRPGLAPGMVGGMLAASLGSGFLGGIAAGFIAGYGTRWLNRFIRLPQQLEGLKPVLILPVLGSLLVGLLMIYVIGQPVAIALAALTGWLQGMQSASAIVLGVLIGAMMAFDMGGPVNKAAYAFSTGLIASQVYTPMAAAMAAGMTPPLGIALATKLFADRFTADEREAGKATAILGLAFISEGAIPYAARDPLRVIPSLMVGSATAAAISMGFGVELKVPHGGIFVLPIPNAVGHLGGYLLALTTGTVLTALMIRLLKKPAV
ncbi:PTS fructose transporter subunit IIC [Paludibacterium paludis]|uniref:protein-N(pi)-phosphohistidine--D-fructose phosphotransferase n=1 Tax=Paludibacterium paludis TaxID=1225769 RepID=A0A918U840_9NEIS|nr:fructose-specific PTS transporter subunit EIIC [Paludibacterium paludis]GGY08279.1 PTS system fructose-specific EIIB'BC component [Paludibacterium paludis]